MTKEEVAKHVFQNNVNLDLDKFNWCELTNTFTTKESGLILRFRNSSNIVFITGSDCKFETEDNCTFITKDNCKFKTKNFCRFITGDYCRFLSEDGCMFNIGSYSIVEAGTFSTVNVNGKGCFTVRNHSCISYVCSVTSIRKNITTYDSKNRVVLLNEYGSEKMVYDFANSCWINDGKVISDSILQELRYDLETDGRSMNCPIGDYQRDLAYFLGARG